MKCIKLIIMVGMFGGCVCAQNTVDVTKHNANQMKQMLNWILSI